MGARQDSAEQCAITRHWVFGVSLRLSVRGPHQTLLRKGQ